MKDCSLSYASSRMYGPPSMLLGGRDLFGHGFGRVVVRGGASGEAFAPGGEDGRVGGAGGEGDGDVGGEGGEEAVVDGLVGEDAVGRHEADHGEAADGDGGEGALR